MVDIAAFYGEPPAPTGLAPSPDILLLILFTGLVSFIVVRRCIWNISFFLR